jgi:hypothetical protein
MSEMTAKGVFFSSNLLANVCLRECMPFLFCGERGIFANFMYLTTIWWSLSSSEKGSSGASCRKNT